MKKKREFSSTQVQLPPVAVKLLTHLGNDILKTDLTGDGLENDFHVTVKYGLHTNSPAKLRVLLSDQPPVKLRLGKTSLFETPEHDVVKADVESDGLRRLNKLIAKSLKHTESFPTYVPHATIAYVKSGRGKKYVGKDTLDGHTVTIDTVYFSNKDGNKIPVALGGDPLEAAIRRRTR